MVSQPVTKMSGNVPFVYQVCLSVGVYACFLVFAVQVTCHLVQRFQVVRRFAESAKYHLFVVVVEILRKLFQHVFRGGLFGNPQFAVAHALPSVAYAKVAVVAATVGEVDVNFVVENVNVVVHSFRCVQKIQR